MYSKCFIDYSGLSKFLRIYVFFEESDFDVITLHPRGLLRNAIVEKTRLAFEKVPTNKDVMKMFESTDKAHISALANVPKVKDGVFVKGVEFHSSKNIRYSRTNSDMKRPFNKLLNLAFNDLFEQIMKFAKDETLEEAPKYDDLCRNLLIHSFYYFAFYPDDMYFKDSSCPAAALKPEMHTEVFGKLNFSDVPIEKFPSTNVKKFVLDPLDDEPTRRFKRFKDLKEFYRTFEYLTKHEYF